MTANLSQSFLSLQKDSSYPQFKAEDNSLHSRWLYGNTTAYLVTSLRNSPLAQKAYHPDGEVQSQGYRALYGTVLVATTIFGLVVDTVHNFLAAASIYFLGKRIWEYKNNQGPFTPSVNAPQDGISEMRINIKNVSLKSDRDSEQCSRMEEPGCPIVIKLDPIIDPPSRPLPDTSKPFNIH